MTPERWAIPASWRWKALREVGLVVGGGTPNTREPANFRPQGTGVPWITPADLSGYDDVYIQNGRRDLTVRGLRASGATLVPPGSVLFSSRAPIGYCAIAKTELATSQGFKNLVINSAMSAEYVHAYLIGSKDYAESLARGTTFKELSAAKFGRLRIPVAPPEEQVAIAAKLRDLRQLSKRTEESVATSRTLSENLRTAILRKAFNGELTEAWRTARRLEPSMDLVARTPSPDQPNGGRGPTDKVSRGSVGLGLNYLDDDLLPPGWSWQPLLRLARQESGHTPSRANASYWDGGIPWVGIRDAANHHGRTIAETLQTVSQRGLDNSSARLLPAGSIILSRTASVGYVCQLDSAMATSQDFVGWVCGPALDPRYLMYLLLAEREYLRSLGKGTTHSTIYIPEIRALTIALAPLAEQKEIVARLDRAFDKLDSAQKELDAARALIPILAKNIHQQAFSGKLSSQSGVDSDLDAVLAGAEVRLLKMAKRKGARESAAEEPTVAQQLADRFEVWPSSGYAFDDLRDILNGSYDDIRAAVFSALRDNTLKQRFDPRRRTMILERGQE